MKNEDIDNMLSNMDLPKPENIKHQQELKIPLLSYKKTSRAGLWLLTLPVIFAITTIIKYDLIMDSPFLDAIIGFFKIIDKNAFLTYLIPLIFMGFPVFALIINFLAFCHFAYNNTKQELIITVKFRALNIALFLFSFVIIIYFLLPDNMP